MSSQPTLCVRLRLVILIGGRQAYFHEAISFELLLTEIYFRIQEMSCLVLSTAPILPRVEVDYSQGAESQLSKPKSRSRPDWTPKTREHWAGWGYKLPYVSIWKFEIHRILSDASLSFVTKVFVPSARLNWSNKPNDRTAVANTIWTLIAILMRPQDTSSISRKYQYNSKLDTLWQPPTLTQTLGHFGSHTNIVRVRG